MDSEDGERWLLIADTHVGLEVELGKKGVRIPSQSARIAQLVLDFAERMGGRLHWLYWVMLSMK